MSDMSVAFITIFGTVASVSGVVIYVFNGTRKLIRMMDQTLAKMDQTISEIHQTQRKIVELIEKIPERTLLLLKSQPIE